jgi:hypothetical protein
MEAAPDVIGARVEELANTAVTAFQNISAADQRIKQMDFERGEYLRGLENAVRTNNIQQGFLNKRLELDSQYDNALQSGVAPDKAALAFNEGLTTLQTSVKDKLNLDLLTTQAGNENLLRQQTFESVTKSVGQAKAAAQENAFKFQTAVASAKVVDQVQGLTNSVLLGNNTVELAHAQLQQIAGSVPQFANDPKF